MITGMGAVSPFGLGVEAIWSALQQGERRAVALDDEQSLFGLKVGALQLANLLGKRGLQYLRPSTQFLLGASLLAMREAALADGGADPDLLGITIGSNLAGLQSMANYDYTAITEGPHYVSPMDAPNTLANAPASHLAIRLKARVINTTIASGQCAGLDALGYAAKVVRDGRAHQIVAGGVEELSPAALWVYRNSNVISVLKKTRVAHLMPRALVGCPVKGLLLSYWSVRQMPSPRPWYASPCRAGRMVQCICPISNS